MFAEPCNASPGQIPYPAMRSPDILFNREVGLSVNGTIVATQNMTMTQQAPACAPEAFAPTDSVQEAEAWTAHLARTHYENFPVISLLLPRSLRQDFCNIYAFCRTADDLADEMHDNQASLIWLEELRNRISQCYDGRPQGKLAVALAGTIARFDIPSQPFLDLIDAFEQDQRITRYDDFPQLLDYCRRSADPVGRLVLYLCGYRDELRQHLSDQTCSALQLTNFWQDVRNDILERDRIYIPQDSMRYFGVTEDQLRQGRCDDNYCELIRFEVRRTEAMFDAGEALLPLLDKSCRGHIALFGQGGRTIQQAIIRQNYDTLTARPVLTARQKSRLILAGLAASLRRLA
ncbi:MAG TPA: squalene synthase HpnC [Tepidisphaeraceae bacterium]|nr:squalene synthase HpnC [Tepidisphaeraceae bacterium]